MKHELNIMYGESVDIRRPYYRVARSEITLLQVKGQKKICIMFFDSALEHTLLIWRPTFSALHIMFFSILQKLTCGSFAIWGIYCLGKTPGNTGSDLAQMAVKTEFAGDISAEIKRSILHQWIPKWFFSLSPFYTFSLNTCLWCVTEIRLSWRLFKSTESLMGQLSHTIAYKAPTVWSLPNLC